ncbi:MAG: hypothetical protein JOZ38_12410 [Candidatus Eremiobacteraeota bacterium]|nr:hypothetical protein [Candidatus Eremiobacteraeota bacterium]
MRTPIVAALSAFLMLTGPAQAVQLPGSVVSGPAPNALGAAVARGVTPLPAAPAGHAPAAVPPAHATARAPSDLEACLSAGRSVYNRRGWGIGATVGVCPAAMQP